MDESPVLNDENKHQGGKKRPQIESPYSAATPKSRIGKEPKRLFGSIATPGNTIDGIEDTLIETDSRPRSATPSDASDITLNMSEMSSMNVDPNLEETELIDPGTSANSTADLSTVQEDDETDADVTLADSFNEKVVFQEEEQEAEKEAETTPTTAPRIPMSPISGSDTPTAPISLTSRFERGLESIASFSLNSVASPLPVTRPHIDHSLHEFELLEQQVDFEVEIKNLQATIEEMRFNHRQELENIGEARKFEEKILMEQMEAAMKKSKTDRQAAKQREEELVKQIEEMGKKLDEPDAQKEQLENQLAQLNTRIEELTEKALSVDVMQQGVKDYEDRIQKMEVTKSEMTIQLTDAQKKIEQLEYQIAANEKRCAEEQENLSKVTDGENVEELKIEHDRTLETMMEKIKKLEEEALQSAEKHQADLAASREEADVKMAEIEKNRYDLAEQVARLSADADQLRSESTSNDRVKELEEELDELRNLMISEVSSLENQLEASRQQTCNTEEIKKISEEAEEKMKEMLATIEQNSSITMKMQSDLDKSTSKNQELTSNMDSLNAELDSLRQLSIEHDQLKKEYEENITKCDLLSTSLAAIQLEYSNLQQQSISTNEQKCSLEIEVESLKDSVESLRAELENANHLNAQIKEDIKQQKEESEEKIAELTNSFESLHQLSSSDNDHLQQKLKDYEEKVEQLTNSLISSETEYAAYRQRIEEENSISVNEMNQLRSEMEKIEQSRDVKIRELEEITKESSGLRDKVEELQNSLENKMVELETVAKEKSNLQEELIGVSIRVSDLTSQLEDSQQSTLELERLNNEVQELTTSLETARSESVCAQQLYDSTIEELKKEIASIESEKEEARQRSEEMRQNLESSEKEAQDTNGLRMRIDELTQRLEASQSEKDSVEEQNKKIAENLQETVDSLQSSLVTAQKAAEDIEKELKEKLEELEMKVQKREQELVNQAENIEKLRTEKTELEWKLSDLQSLFDALYKEKEESKFVDKDVQALTARVVELEKSASSAEKDLHRGKEALLAKEEELKEALEKVKELDSVATEEKSSRQAIEESIADFREKLALAERALSEKETAVVSLESRIETINKQFEERLAEATTWKDQAMNMGSLTSSVVLMQEQLRDLTEKLEASNRRVVEVEETAQHDITIMADEKLEQTAALEEARTRITELESKLVRAEKEIERLEKVCDDFDDEERELKDKIAELQGEVKLLKGVKSPPKVMGLLQQARLGVKPLSRESSKLEPPSNEDGFEDAHDSFQAQKEKSQKSFNVTAQQPDSPNVPVASKTILHPDDDAIEKSVMDTPSKKNRSNCQHQ